MLQVMHVREFCHTYTIFPWYDEGLDEVAKWLYYAAILSAAGIFIKS